MADVTATNVTEIILAVLNTSIQYFKLLFKLFKK